MPQFCAVINCSNNSASQKLSFFRFPSERDNNGKTVTLRQKRRQEWISKLRRADLTELKIKHSRICAKHFISGKPAVLKDVDNPDWVPSINLGYKTNSNTSVNVERHNRIQQRRSKKQMIDTIENDRHLEVQPEPEQQQQETSEMALRNANERIYKLEAELSKFRLDESTFKNNNNKVLFYTGLKSWELLKIVFDEIETFIPERPSLTKFQQLIATLMKLRLNLLFTDLGFRFNVDRRTVSRSFYNCINILYTNLKWLVHWPSENELKAKMPKCFQQVFGDKVTVVIDCFEVFIEKSSNPSTLSSTFSHYKHHHTMKFLIGITPQGSISFISAAFGGKCSDKYITEKCGILDKLTVGSLVMADRGFLINEVVAACGACLITPEYTKGKKQLHPKAVQETRNLANVRIHVERVIGQLKQKYTILDEVMAVTLLKNKEENLAFVDKIVTVCSALCNLNPSIVPYF